MKLALFSVLLLAVLAFSGCTGGDPTPTPSTSPTVSTRPTTTSAAPTTSPTNTTGPREDERIFHDTVKWANPNEEKPMTVPSGATSLQVNAQVNTTGAGAYNLAGPGPNEKPYLELKPPTGASTKIEFVATSGVATAGDPNVFSAQEVDIPNPPSGSWTLTVVGTGTNVHAYAVVVASFA